MLNKTCLYVVAESADDARLMIASPKLYEALRKLAKCFDGVDDGHCKLCGANRKHSATKGKTEAGPCRNKQCLTHEVRDALAQAEGKSDADL